jgi:hypothetical protein
MDYYTLWVKSMLQPWTIQGEYSDLAQAITAGEELLRQGSISTYRLEKQ